MYILASGSIYDKQEIPVHRSDCAFTTINQLRDGTILVSGRWGSARDSVDGHAFIYATSDTGLTWCLRYDGFGKGNWDGRLGEFRGLVSTEIAPGQLTATALWVDRSNLELPFINPKTQGLLPMRIMHLESEDAGYSWSSPRPMETTPHSATSPCSFNIIKLRNGVLGQPYEQWKEYTDPAPGKPVARLRFSKDAGRTWPDFVNVAKHPDNTYAYWDQRLAVHPNDGNIVAMFWTHDFNKGVDIDIHIAYGTPDGRSWTEPQGTGLNGQHCQPLWLDGDRLLAVYPCRKNPSGIVLSISEDFGKTWDRQRDLLVYDSTAGPESGSAHSRTQAELWGDMERWRFGHPRMVLLPGNEVFIVYYAGHDSTKTVRWARVKI